MRFSTPRNKIGRNHGYKPIPISKLELTFANVKHLSDQVCVYPQPDQLIFRGRKTYLIRQLREIAAEVTKTPFPKAFVLENPLDEEYVDHESVVIKREYSECGDHVFLPSRIRQKEDDAASSRKEDLKAMVSRTKRYYKFPELKNLGVVPQWFMVPYLDTVRDLGELRAYFFAGRLRYVLHTDLTTSLSDEGRAAGMVYLADIAVGITPLDCLRYVENRLSALAWADYGLPSSKNPEQYEQKVWKIANSTLPKALQNRGMEEFTSFVTKTFEALVFKDEAALTEWTDYRIFCRLDVAVLPLPGGRYAWYVNELECSANAGLGINENFAGGEHFGIPTDLAMALRSYASVNRRS